MKLIRSLALILLSSAAINFAASPTWYIQLAPNVAGPWSNAVSGTSSQMFARLVLSNAPASTVNIGGVLMVPSITMSNGIGYATVLVASNDWCNFCCRPGTNTIQWRLTITHQ